MEPKAIAAIVEKIARSPLSVSAYFKRHKVPFGRSRYFQYKAQLAANGLDGLVGGRSGGNRRELTAHAQGFIRGVHQENPQLSLRQIADRVESSCGIRVSRMTVSRCLRAVGLKVQWPLPVKAETIGSGFAGLQRIGASACGVTAKDVTARGSSREPITAGPKSARNALPPWRTSAKAKTTRAWRCSRAASSFWSASVWAFWPCR